MRRLGLQIRDFSSSRLLFTIDFSFDLRCTKRLFSFFLSLPSFFYRLVDMAAGGETCRCEVLFFAGSSSLVVEISYKLQIENRAEQFRASDEAPPPRRRSAVLSFSPIRLLLSPFLNCAWKHEKRAAYRIYTAGSDCWQPDSWGKEQRPLCSSGSHMEQSGRGSGTRTNSCTPTCSIKDDWNESLLPMAGVFYSKLGFMFRADVANRWFTVG